MKWILFILCLCAHHISSLSECIIRHNEAMCTGVTTLPLMITEMVRNLTIRSSYLPRIEAYSFINAPRIQMLRLSGNQISIIEANAFTGLLDLKNLYLDDNDIRLISESAFEEAIVYEVDLRFNKLEQFPKALTTVPSLTKLDLRNNDIAAINYALTPLRNLRELLLQNNSLRMIDPDVFQGLRKLRLANLTGNPYHCDCHLPPLDNWLTSFYFSRHSTELLSLYRCVSPPTFKGKPFDAFNLHGACLIPELSSSRADCVKISGLIVYMFCVLNLGTFLWG